MKYFILLICGILMASNAQGAFIEGLEDVPVMEGLEQIPHDSISFGNEESRLVEAILTSKKIKFKQVAQFYKNTLPQMGWTYQGSRGGKTLIFEREGEVIDISEEAANPLMVRLTVKSKIQ